MAEEMQIPLPLETPIEYFQPVPGSTIPDYLQSVLQKGVLTGTASPDLIGGRLDLGSGNSVLKYDEANGFWLGNQTFASAPFRVTMAGAVTATSATITGVVTANTGKIGGSTNYWDITAGALTAVSTDADVIINYGKTDFGQDSTAGFILGYDYSATASKFEIGASASKLFKYDGTDITILGGIIQTASSGERIEMGTTVNNSQHHLSLYDSAGTMVLRIGHPGITSVLTIKPNSTYSSSDIGLSIDQPNAKNSINISQSGEGEAISITTTATGKAGINVIASGNYYAYSVGTPGSESGYWDSNGDIVPNRVKVDHILEKTAGAGVNIDNTPIKDRTVGAVGSEKIKGKTLHVKDGITAPSRIVGEAIIFVDSEDGDLKVTFGDGTTKTIKSN